MALVPVVPTPLFSDYGTVKEAYVDILTELVKEGSPTLYVEDFLYYYNKAITEYIKTRYQLFEITQQVSDDLRFWKKEKFSNELEMPLDEFEPRYMHLLTCMVDIKATRPVMICGLLPGVNTVFKATRLTSEVKAAILDNEYLKIQFYRPYFDIMDNKLRVLLGEYDENIIKLSTITVEYLCRPVPVYLTAAQIESTNDTSQRLEFSSDVGGEIVKIAIKLILERSADQRTQSHIAVNQTVTDPTIGGKR